VNSEPTLVAGILLSDMVIREQGSGKLSLIGCFNAFNAARFPFITPPFFVTAFIANLRGKISEADITARIEARNSGHVLQSVAGHIQFQTNTPPLPADFMLEMPFPVAPFKIDNAGVYSVVILMNNEKLGERTFSVAGTTTAAQPGGQPT
jgi:hypothetical protein